MSASVLKATSYDHNTKHLMSSEEQHHHLHLPQHLQPNHNLHYTTKRRNFSTAPSYARKKVPKGNEEKGKQRRRGMGVEQLERLRLGEEWKKMTEINPNGVPPSSSDVPVAVVPPAGAGVRPPSSSSGVPFAVIPAASLGHDSTLLHTTVPLHLAAKYGAFGCTTSNVSTRVVGLPSSHQKATALWIPGIGLFYGQGQLVPDVNFQRNLYGVSNGSEASKELSSTPNLTNSYPDRCSVCQKKRNYQGMYKRAKDMNPGMPTSDSVGYNVNNSQNNQAKAFGKIANFNAGGNYVAGRTDQTVDAENVQRKPGGSSRVGGTGSCITEYEFFPAYVKNSEIDSDERGLMMIKKLVLGDGSEFSSSVASLIMSSGGGGPGGGGDNSCVTTRTTSCGGAGFVDITSPIDLSLKLSY